MEPNKKIKIWLAQFRANFLVLSIFLVLIAFALTYNYTSKTNSEFNVLNAILVLVGVIAAHSSVNLFNEYSDFKTKIDENTDRTPFSGGSGMLQSGLTSAPHVLIAAFSMLLIALLVGVYFFIASHWTVMIIAIIGGASIVFYSTFFAKIMLGEFIAGLSLGSLVVLGGFIALTGNYEATLSQILPMNVVIISIPPGILTFLLLLLNEFPDAEADKKGGRNHMVIKLGKKASAIIYSIGMFGVFAVIVLIPVFELASWWFLIALLTAPFALKACIIAMKHGNDNQKMIPAQALNIIVVLFTDLLIAIALFIG